MAEAVRTPSGGDAGGEVSVGDQLDARARFPDLGDEVVMPFAVEDDDGQLVDVALKGLGDLVEVFMHGVGEAHEVGRGRTDDDLVHVDVGCVGEAAFLRGCQDGDGVRGAGGAEVRSFERIDGDVDLGVDFPFGPASSEGLAHVKHRRLVALSLADDDRATHLEPVQLLAHRFDGHLVGVLSLAVAHRPCRGDGCFFGDAQKADLETGFHDAPFLPDLEAQTLAESGQGSCAGCRPNGVLT
jgi:hypothetical protein